MAKSKYTFHKREREKARKEKQDEKRARRIEAKRLKKEGVSEVSDESSHINGIQPDPQSSAAQDNEEHNDPTVEERKG